MTPANSDGCSPDFPDEALAAELDELRQLLD